MIEPIPTVAVVDDNHLDRRILKSLLENNGFKIIIEAENGQDFLDQLGKEATPPQICILDVFMPVLDGFNTAKKLRKLYPEVIIICVSNISDQQMVRNVISSGAHTFLPKGFHSQDFVRTLLTLLKGKI